MNTTSALAAAAHVNFGTELLSNSSKCGARRLETFSQLPDSLTSLAALFTLHEERFLRLKAYHTEIVRQHFNQARGFSISSPAG